MELKFRKLKANEIDVRVGRVIESPNWKGVSLLLYKDARVDMDILDETVGAMNWKREHTRDNANCIVSIWDSEKGQWVSKEDTGTESNTEKEKGLASDSFKRACVNWSIGRELYTAKGLLADCEIVNGKPANGISWYVKEIGYDESGCINHLVVVEKKRSAERVVYTLGEKKCTQEQIDKINKLGVIVENVLKKYHKESLNELSWAEADYVIKVKEAQNG